MMKKVHGLEREVSMLQTNVLAYQELRRANRMPWNRPVKILAPQRMRGRSVNVSATGILVRLPLKSSIYSPQVGDRVKLAIPNLENTSTLEVSGKVVRVEFSPQCLRFAVDLTS
jgi:hypothetical protein